MLDPDSTSIDAAQLQGSALDFYEYSADELARRRDSGEEFDESAFHEAVELVLRRMQHLEEEGAL